MANHAFGSDSPCGPRISVTGWFREVSSCAFLSFSTMPRAMYAKFQCATWLHTSIRCIFWRISYRQSSRPHPKRNMKIPSFLQALYSPDLRLSAFTSHALSRIEDHVVSTRMVFFPEYTDHGIRHIELTLQTALDFATAPARELLTPIRRSSVIWKTCPMKRQPPAGKPILVEAWKEVCLETYRLCRSTPKIRQSSVFIISQRQRNRSLAEAFWPTGGCNCSELLLFRMVSPKERYSERWSERSCLTC